MSPELILAIFTGLAGLLGEWNRRQGKRIKALTERIKTLTDQVDQLTTWRDTARAYIGQLLFVMAVHGVKPPDPPDALGLTVPAGDNPAEG